jgi:hypothetical protein
MNVKAALLLAVVLIAAGCRVDGPDHGGIDPPGGSGGGAVSAYKLRKM